VVEQEDRLIQTGGLQVVEVQVVIEQEVFQYLLLEETRLL
jgi:hypothetical protein